MIAAAGVSVAFAAVPTVGRFSGPTSQRGPGYAVSFKVAGGEIQNMRIAWRAVCVSHQALSRGTSQGSTRILIRHGAWKSSGSYTGHLPYGPGLVGHFRVLQNSGHFQTQRRAAGVFRLRLAIYHGGRRIDSCETPRIVWTATA